MEDYKATTIKTYGRTVDKYHELTKDIEMSELPEFLTKISPNSLILDYGCGPGRDCIKFAKAGHNVVGIDLCIEMLEKAKEVRDITKDLSVSPVYLKMDIEKLNFKDNYFDAIWSTASLLHLKRSAVQGAVDEMYRVLKPGGLVFVSVKKIIGKSEEKRYDSRYGLTEESGLFKQFTYFEPSELEDVLRNSGFNIDETQNKSKESHAYNTNPWISVYCRK